MTALIYEQTCAAEKRRRRKRGNDGGPAKASPSSTISSARAAAIARSHPTALSVEPKETRIRTQAQDRPVELQQGFLLSRGILPELRHHRGRDAAQEGCGRGARRASRATCPRPPCPGSRRLTISWSPASAGPASSRSARVVGDGRASRGSGASVLDFTGFAQKFGSVLSYVRIATLARRHQPAAHRSRVGGRLDRLRSRGLLRAQGVRRPIAGEPERSSMPRKCRPATSCCAATPISRRARAPGRRRAGRRRGEHPELRRQRARGGTARRQRLREHDDAWLRLAERPRARRL